MRRGAGGGASLEKGQILGLEGGPAPPMPPYVGNPGLVETDSLVQTDSLAETVTALLRLWQPC